MAKHEKELLAVPMRDVTSAGEVYSGIARLAGRLWCARHRANPGRNAEVAVLVMHPSSNFLGHYALDAWADRGVDAIAMTTRYLGNDSTLLLENCVVDVGTVIAHLRDVEGYEKVVLIGNSGGGGLSALYQEQAEKPTITSSPCGGGPDLTRAELSPADALVMLMAHPGRANLLTEWLDPAVGTDEDPLAADPFNRNPELDMFEEGNGPSYDAEWLERYRSAQRARGDAITDWVVERLAEVDRRSGGRAGDIPFTVQATCADPRFLDLRIDPSDRERGTLWGDAYTANLQPSTLGHHTSLRSWLSQWSLRTSHGNGPDRLTRVSVPVHVIYGTGDQGCFPSHARELYDAVPHARKELTAIRGGKHYLNGQTELTEEMAEHLVGWSIGSSSGRRLSDPKPHVEGAAAQPLPFPHEVNSSLYVPRRRVPMMVANGPSRVPVIRRQSGRCIGDLDPDAAARLADRTRGSKATGHAARATMSGPRAASRFRRVPTPATSSSTRSPGSSCRSSSTPEPKPTVPEPMTSPGSRSSPSET